MKYSILFTLREHRFYRIYGVIKLLRYIATAARLMPCIYGKLGACKIQVIHDSKGKPEGITYTFDMIFSMESTREFYP